MTVNAATVGRHVPGQAPQQSRHEASLREPFALGIFGISLGLAGLAGGWLAASSLLGAPRWPDEALYGLSAVLWAVFSIAYLVQGVRGAHTFRDDLTHPFVGPLTAYIPTVAILLSAHYSTYFPHVGPWVTVAFVLALAILMAQLVAHWLMGNLQVERLQGAYFIPVVAGPFVASIGMSIVGFHLVALWAFGAALFFWLTFGTIIMFRLMTGPRLPTPAIPTAAAFLAAAASASVAWILSHPGPVGEPLNILTGILFIMLLVQAVLILDYRKVPFTLSYWVFVFPVASATTYFVRWLAVADISGWRVWAWGVLGVGTTFISTIGIATIVVSVRGLGRRPWRPRSASETRE